MRCSFIWEQTSVTYLMMFIEIGKEIKKYCSSQLVNKIIDIGTICIEAKLILILPTRSSIRFRSTIIWLIVKHFECV